MKIRIDDEKKATRENERKTRNKTRIRKREKNEK